MADYKPGLSDQDELSQFPNASDSLAAFGIDPDEAAKNPDIISKFGPPKSTFSAVPRVARPAESPSAATAGALGGAGDTSTTPAEPTDTKGYGLSGLSHLEKSLRGAEAANQDLSTTPPADVARLQAQQEKLGTPAPTRDASGKPLKSTKEWNPETQQYDEVNPQASTGSKIWRGIRSGLVGAVTGGIPGAVVGALEPQDIRGGTAYGAPSKAYSRAEERREQELGATDTALKSAMQTWKDVNEAKGKKASELRAIAGLGKDEVTGATGLMNAENKPETENEKEAAKVKLDQQTYEQRKQRIQTDPILSKLPALQKAFYMSEGKVYQPHETSEGDVLAGNMARSLSTFKAQNGGRSPNTLEEFNQMVASAKGELGKGKGKPTVTPQQEVAVADKKKAAIEKANSEFAKKMYMPGAIQDYQLSLQEAQNAYEEESSLLAGGDSGPHMVVTVDPKTHQATWTPQAPAVAGTPTGPGAPAPTKPQPAPDGTRRQSPDGTIEVKKAGQWVKE